MYCDCIHGRHSYICQDPRRARTIHENGTPKITGKRSISETEECEFNKTTMEYLGLIIKEGQLLMDPVKLKGISDWPVPTTVKQVRAFLGFGNFYRRFI